LALGSTVHQFTVQLSDVNRGVYEPVDLRVARHPSESEPFLCARVLACCLEWREGLAFSKGLSDPERPALEVRDLTGTVLEWIEVGMPDAARLHRASKATPRVAVYTHHETTRYWSSLAGGRLDRALVGALAERLDRRMAFDLSVNDDVLYVTLGEESFSGVVTTHRLAAE
jgi:uncharacterized protein YaeQ